MQKKSVFLGIVLGGITAGITTLLTAPSSGKETRYYIKKHKDEWIKQMRALKKDLIDLKDSTVYASKEGKTVITSLVKDVNSLIGTWKQEAHYHQEAIMKELEEIGILVSNLEADLKHQE